MSHKWYWNLPGGLDGDCPKGKGAVGSEPVPDVKPVERPAWPLPARVIAKMAEDGDKGVGDVVQRLTGKVPGLDALAAMLPDCSCASRQIKWNQLYPL